jgi:hypothetical protein
MPRTRRGGPMIHGLRMRNFYSFRDATEIRLTTTFKFAPDDSERFAPVFKDSSIRAPKVVALFGPNAAGKSTVLRALGFLSWFVQNSFGLQPGVALPCARFNDEECRRSPIALSIRFGAPADLSKATTLNSTHCEYEYSLTLSGGDLQPTTIKSETLAYWPPGASRRVRVFERDDEGIRGAHPFYLSGFQKPLQKVLRPNVSMISTLVQLGHDPSIALQNIARQVRSNILIERQEILDQFAANFYLQRPEVLSALNREIQRLDLGIEEVIVSKGPTAPHIPQTTFIHRGLASPIALPSESQGTRHFFRIFPVIFQTLETGGVAVIDEMDNSVHPLLLPEILRWFYDSSRNPLDAQIWFTCQSASLLQDLSKEEVFFCEKDEFGCTTAFGLKEITSVRRIDNYMKKYLGGSYGSVPHIG